MTLRRIFVFICALNLLLCFNINCFADSDSYKKNKYLYNKEEFDKVAWERTSSPYEVLIEENIHSLCYIYHFVGSENCINEIKNGAFFDDYLQPYVVDLTSKRYNHYYFLEKDGKYTHIESLFTGEDANPKCYVVDFEKVEKAVNSIGVQMGDDNLVIKVINNECISAIYRIVYIRYNGEQYFIPFDESCEEIYGLEHGKMYSFDDFVPLLEKHRFSSHGYIIESEDEKTVKNAIPYIIGASCVLIIASTTVILLVIRNKKKQKTINTET